MAAFFRRRDRRVLKPVLYLFTAVVTRLSGGEPLISPQSSMPVAGKSPVQRWSRCGWSYLLSVCRVCRGDSVKDEGPIRPRGYPALPSLEPMLALY